METPSADDRDPGDENAAPAASMDLMTEQAFRDRFVREKQRERESEYTTFHELRVLAGTFNANGKKPQGDVRGWIKTQDGAEPDIVVLSFQEIVDLTATNALLDSQSRARSAEWEDTVARALDSAYGEQRFKLLRSRYLMGILLLVFVHERVQNALSEVQDEIAAVGIMGVVGNKGGIAVRCNIYDSSVCFVGTHLAAHRGNVEGRNANYQAILEKMVFREVEAEEGTKEHRELAGPGGVLDHDVVVWAGDLNYRVEEALSTDEVMERAKAKDLEPLLVRDQLNRQRAVGKAFAAFEEASISFPPTYKFEPGTDRYDERPDKKRRAPAWCDRVLWRARRAGDVRVLRYASCPHPAFSDHKPVAAEMTVRARVVDAERAKAVRRAILADLDRFENEHLPRLEVSRSALRFDALRYGTPVSQRVTIRNVGASVAHVQFVPKADSGRVSQPWLTVTPLRATILPRAEIEATFTACVTRDTVHDLHHITGVGDLNDMLVLEVLRSGASFFEVFAQYERSCFGMALEELVHTHTSVRDAVQRARERLEEAMAPVERDLKEAKGVKRTTTLSERRAQLLMSSARFAPSAEFVRAGAGPGAADAAVDPASGRRRTVAGVGRAVLSPMEENAMHHLCGRYSADGGTRPAAATPPEQVASAGGAGAGEGGGQWVEPLLGAPQLREPLLVPKELWRMADWLWRHGLGAEELFQRPAEEGGVAQVREALDTNQPFPEDTSPHAVADALVRFLEALPWPVVPRSLQPVHLVDAGELPLWSARLLAQLPPLAHNVFVYVCAFLREAVKHASGNGLTAEAIAEVLGPALFQSDRVAGDPVKQQENATQAQQLLLHLLSVPEEEQGGTAGAAVEAAGNTA